MPDRYSLDAQADKKTVGFRNRLRDYYDRRDEVKTKEEVKAFVINQLKRGTDHRANYIDPLFRRIKRAYIGYKQPLQRKHIRRSNIRVWHAFKQVESALPHYMLSILQGEYPILVTQLGESSTQEGAFSVQNLLTFQFNSQMKPHKKLYNLLKNNLMYGFSPVRIHWKYKPSWKYLREYEFDKDDNPIKIKKEKVEGPAKQHPDFFPIQVDRFYWDPTATCLEEASWVIEIVKTTRRELKRLEKFGICWDVDNVPERRIFTPNVNDSSLFSNSFYNVLRTNLFSRQVTINDLDEEIEVIRYHEPDREIWVGNRETVIKDGENPFDHDQLPFQVFNHLPILEEFVGIGVVEPIMDLEKEANLKRNQRIDNVNLIINKMFKMKKGGGLVPRTLESTPGKVFPVDNMDDLEELPTSDATASSYQEEAIDVRDMDLVNGNFGDVTRGESTVRKEQATVFLGREENASARFEIVNLMIQEDIVNMFEMFHHLNKQFLPDRTPFKILGELGQYFPRMTIDRGDLFEDYDFAIGHRGYYGNKQVEQAKLMQLLNVIIQDPLIDRTKVYEDVFRGMNFRDPWRYINKPETEKGNFRDPRQENWMMLLEKVQVPVFPGDKHTDHLFYHIQLRDNLGRQVDQVVLQLLDAHILQHNQMQQAQLAQAAGGIQGRQLTGSGEQPVNTLSDITQNVANAGSLQ